MKAWCGCWAVLDAGVAVTVSVVVADDEVVGSAVATFRVLEEAMTMVGRGLRRTGGIKRRVDKAIGC